MLNANVFTEDTIEATIVLHRQPTALAPVVTETTPVPPPSIADFEARRKVGIGTFITQAELTKHSGDRVSDVLRGRITGVRYVERSCGGLALANGAPATVALSDSKPIAVAGCTVPKLCYFQLYVDGVHMYSYDGATLPPDIDQFLLDQVEAIEVYGGGARTPAPFNSTGAACGTIVVWLKR
jgi:hypothetical protein